jgi:hypothetical protein
MKTIIASLILAATLAANVRVNIRLGAGHPIARTRPVVVRRTPIVAPRAVVYAPVVRWSRAVVSVPPRNRVVWEDSETIARRDEWVDTHFSVNNTGDALLLKIDGRASIDFAEVHFRNGQVQVVDFNEGAVESGTFGLMNFSDGRFVQGVRIVARARSPRAVLTVLIKK